jgi:hypothetical protein
VINDISCSFHIKLWFLFHLNTEKWSNTWWLINSLFSTQSKEYWVDVQEGHFTYPIDGLQISPCMIFLKIVLPLPFPLFYLIIKKRQLRNKEYILFWLRTDQNHRNNILYIMFSHLLVLSNRRLYQNNFTAYREQFLPVH